MTIQPKTFLEPIETIARGAGAILMKHFRNLDGFEKKGEIDLVTVADKESEAFVEREILSRFPDHAVLGEEGGKSGNSESDYLWIVDPLDGTTNFAHGMKSFAVSIGLIYKGEIIAGAVFAPALDEMYLAAAGCGATRNGAALRVSPTTTLNDSLIAMGFPYNRAMIVGPLMEMLGQVVSKSRGVVRLGAAAYDFACVAAGHLEGFYEVGLKPWDCAAGVLLVREAGGVVTGITEEAYDLYGNQVLATNGGIHQELGDLLRANGAQGAV